MELTLPPTVSSCDDSFIAPARRLTRFELAYALHDVFGIDASRLHDLAPPDRSIGDVPDIVVGRVLPTGPEFLKPFAAHVEALLPALLPSIVGRCRKANRAAQCVHAALREPLALLHRAPLNDPEGTASVHLRDALNEVQGQGVEAMARAGLRWVLLSPNFYTVMSEPPAEHEPRSFARRRLAQRLALALWSSVPDVVLLELAESGRLEEPVIFEQQVRRMRADPRFERFAREFSRQWLRLDRSPEFRPHLHERRLILDPERFAAIGVEVSELVGQNLDERGPVRGLLQGERSLLRSRALLTALSSPIQGGGDENWLGRGMLIQSALLCRNFPLAAVYPVEAWDWHPLLDPKRDHSTTRPGEVELLRRRTADQPCAQCHTQLETLGAALAQYDGFGVPLAKSQPHRVPEAEQLARELGRAAAVPLSDADAVAAWVVGSGRFERCVAQKLSTYILSRAVLPARRASDRCLVSALVGGDPRNATLDSMFTQLLLSPEFRSPGTIKVTDRPTPLPNSALYRDPIALVSVSPEQCASFAPARFLVEQCGTSACHGPGSQTGAFAFGDESLTRSALLRAKPNPQGYCKEHPSLLEPEQPSRSLVRQKLLGGEVCGAPMPITGGARSMGDVELACLVRWLEDAASPAR